MSTIHLNNKVGDIICEKQFVSKQQQSICISPSFLFFKQEIFMDFFFLLLLYLNGFIS